MRVTLSLACILAYATAFYAAPSGLRRTALRLPLVQPHSPAPVAGGGSALSRVGGSIAVSPSTSRSSTVMHGLFGLGPPEILVIVAIAG